MKQALLLSFGLAALIAISAALTADENKSSCCKDKAQSTVSTTSEEGASCPASGKCCGHAQQTTVALAADDAPKDKEKKVQPKCPVSNEEISKDAAVDYKGGKVYFCCEDCAGKFKKDKAKYETKANLQLVATGQAKQKGCPMSGGKINESTKIEVAGIPVAFCCEGCQGKVKQADAEKQREMIFGNKGFEKAFALKKDKAESSKN